MNLIGNPSELFLEATKGSILELNYPPLNKDTKFLAGYKKTMAIPKMSDDGNIDIAGKQSGDEQIRNSAMMAMLSMPLMGFFLALIINNHF